MTFDVSLKDVKEAIEGSSSKRRGTANKGAARLSKRKTSNDNDNDKPASKNITRILLLVVASLLVAGLVKGGLRLDLSSAFIEERITRQSQIIAELESKSNHSTMVHSKNNASNKREDNKSSLPLQLQRTFISQSYVISSHRKNAIEFFRQNRQAGFSKATWFPATNGKDQSTLEEWSAMTNAPLLKLSNFNAKTIKEGYENPHAVGCFLSHWHLLRLASSGWHSLGVRPDALFVFEDDAICANNTKRLAETTIRQLPDDWDVLFIGGKPISYMQDGRNNTTIMDINDDEEAHRSVFRDLLCKGEFGTSNSGPWAPNGTPNISHDQQYWKIGYLTNTQSYVVNPHRIERVLRILSRHMKKGYTLPVDIVLANAMRTDLNAYMTNRELCVQEEFLEDNGPPNLWEGYYSSPQVGGYYWSEMAVCGDKSK